LASANLLLETNTFHDRHLTIPQQHERLDAQIESLRGIERQVGRRAVINIIGLQEVQVIGERHNGKTIQKELGYRFGAWQPHSRVKHGENIGVISSVEPDSFEPLELDKNRYAMVLRYDEFCLVVVHQMFSDKNRRRVQFEALFEYLDGEECAGVMGDFNEDPIQLGMRTKFGRLGMESAFVRDYKGHPVTLPAPGYGQYRPWRRRVGFTLLGGGMRYDDIYVTEALKVNRTGTVDSASDHRFVWADVDRVDKPLVF